MKIDLFRKLCMNFNKEPNEELYLLWNEELEEYDQIYVEEAIKEILSTDRYFPTIARIMEVLKTIKPREFTEEEKTKRMEQRGVIPKWLYQDIKNEPIDKETEKEFEDFNKFIEDFRKEEEENENI
ncbi:MAG: hypothetical protein IKO78_02475 [Bacilli bacterium]|nr:hypothetical protein [Bacilli bacterium]